MLIRWKFTRQCCLHMNVNNSDAYISLQVKQKAWVCHAQNVVDCFGRHYQIKY